MKCRFCHQTAAERIVGVEPDLRWAAHTERIRIDKELVKPACEDCADLVVEQGNGREMPLPPAGEATEIWGDETDRFEITDNETALWTDDPLCADEWA